jgi:hypothetical protein
VEAIRWTNKLKSNIDIPGMMQQTQDKNEFSVSWN